MGSSCLGSLPVMRAFDAKNRVYLAYRIRCRMWDCEICANANRIHWASRIREGVNWYKSLGVNQWAMLTVTSNAKNTNFEQCAYVWPDAWKKLSMRMRRRWSPRYALLPEKHDDGRLHMHMLVGAPKFSYRLTTRWLKNTAAACGLGHQAKVERLRDLDKSVYYVTKYLGKTLEQEQWPDRFRRIRVNNRWPHFNWEDANPDLRWLFWESMEHGEIADKAEQLADRSGFPVKVL